MFELVRRNQWRSGLLAAVLTALLMATGATAGAWYGNDLMLPGAVGAGLVALVLFVTTYYSGSALLLRAAGAQPVSREAAPQLHNVVEEMAIACGLAQPPAVYVIDSDAANAFASGRDEAHASITVTRGLLQLLSRAELQAVVGHEMAHIRHRDVLFMTLLAVMASAIGIVTNLLWSAQRFGGGRRDDRNRARGANRGQNGGAAVALFVVGLAIILFGALAARLMFLAASRSREYMADAGSAICTRDPAALADALEKIAGSSHAVALPKSAQALLIVGAQLFSTHPPIEARIAILRRLAGGPVPSYGDYAARLREVTGKRGSFLPKAWA